MNPVAPVAQVATTPPPRRTARLAGWFSRRWAARGAEIRRTLPRDLLIVAVVVLFAQHGALLWVRTDSVRVRLALGIKGARPQPGQLAWFGYAGGALPNYYRDDALARQLRRVGLVLPIEGPRRGTGFAKVLLGVAGDRIEVTGDHVYLHTRRGRLDAGRLKATSRNGDTLTPIQPQVIPEGFVYMWAPHPDALDSRYAVMGLVPVDRIVGRAVALW